MSARTSHWLPTASLTNRLSAGVARGTPVKVYEVGLSQRLVIIEFESVKKAIEAYESPEYQAALAILKDSAERDVRII
ncbi:MAG: hypothetical protein DMF71_15100 [Acidobacteria bacterium]|nr:MAG: hypothetical protein DMF71_15100 [Acidobacteriota bacterium]